MQTALLFEGDAVEEVDDWSECFPRLGRSSVLWIDLEGADGDEIDRLKELLELRAVSVSALTDDDASRTPTFADFGDYLHVTVCAPTDDDELRRVDCLVSERWVVTAHERPLDVMETYRERASGSGDTGKLDGLEFLANLLEWVLESYFDAFERIELDLEKIDTSAMSGTVSSKDEVIAQLVEVRGQIGKLRRALTSHREPILALTRPELEAITSSNAAERFAALRDRLETAVQAARDSRESVVGSFDVLLASTGQRTNEIMKVLTLVSVLILPGTLLAGVMGMNFKLGLFTEDVYFWVVIAAMVLIAIVTLVVARMRDWV
jgi:magnesium/cobalt transport protein CorA